jgi:hypothetical protein
VNGGSGSFADFLQVGFRIDRGFYPFKPKPGRRRVRSKHPFWAGFCIAPGHRVMQHRGLQDQRDRPLARIVMKMNFSLTFVYEVGRFQAVSDGLSCGS